MTFEEYTRHIDWSLTSAGGVNAVDCEHREVVTTNRAPDGRRVGL